MVPQLLAVFLQLRDPHRQPFAQPIESLTELAHLVAALQEDVLAGLAAADAIGDLGELAERPGKPAGQAGAQRRHRHGPSHRGDAEQQQQPQAGIGAVPQ